MVTVKLFSAGFLADLDRQATRMADMSSAFKGPVDQTVRAFYKRQFATEGRAGARSAWRKLSPVTLALKARARRGNMGMLRFTNRLYRSYVNRTGPDTLFRVTPGSYERASTVPYADRHQKGWMQTHIFGRPLKRPHWVPPRQVPTEPMPRWVTDEVGTELRTFLTTGKLQYGSQV